MTYFKGKWKGHKLKSPGGMSDWQTNEKSDLFYYPYKVGSRKGVFSHLQRTFNETVVNGLK